MRKLVVSLIPLILVFVLGACNQVSGIWPAAYPKAPSETSSSTSSVTIKVSVPAVIVAGVPAPVLLTFSTDKETAALPRLLLSALTPVANSTITKSTAKVQSQAGAAVLQPYTSSPLPTSPDNWAKATNAYPYTLPLAQIKNGTQIPLLLTIYDTSIFSSGAWISADTGPESTAAKAVTLSVSGQYGLPSLSSSGVINARNAQMPEPPADPQVPTDVKAPTPGTSLDSWVPEHLAPNAPDQAKTLNQVLLDTTLPQIITYQLPWSAQEVSGLTAKNCAIPKGGVCEVVYSFSLPQGSQEQSGWLLYWSVSAYANALDPPVVKGWQASVKVGQDIIPAQIETNNDNLTIKTTKEFTLAPGSSTQITLSLTAPSNVYSSCDILSSFGSTTSNIETISSNLTIDAKTGFIYAAQSLPGQISDNELFPWLEAKGWDQAFIDATLPPAKN